MTTIEKIKEILCTVPEVEKDLMELKFRCRVVVENDNEECILEWKYLYTDEEDWLLRAEILLDDNNQISSYYWWDDNASFTLYNKIIWNPLQRRHLLMYCNIKVIDIDINSCWTIWKDNWTNKPIAKLDNTKDLEDQPEETLEKILAFLESVQ